MAQGQQEQNLALQRQIWNATCDTNQLNSTLSNLDRCQTQGNIQGIQTISNNLTRFQEKYQSYKSIIDNLNATGEELAGQAANAGQLGQVNSQLESIKKQQREIDSEIKKYEEITQINAQDFLDTKEKLPDILPVSQFRVLEDYTLALFLGSLILLSVVSIFGYVGSAGFSFINLFQAVFVVFLFCMIILLFIYYSA
jgi:hypothetical protein